MDCPILFQNKDVRQLVYKIKELDQMISKFVFCCCCFIGSKDFCKVDADLGFRVF